MSNYSFMIKRNVVLYLILSIFLTGCFQTTAMIGPAFTVAYGGSIPQAGFSFANRKSLRTGGVVRLFFDVLVILQ